MKMELSPVYDEYRIFRCSDCDPEYDEPDEKSGYDHAYEVILPVDKNIIHGLINESCPIDFCPRCQSHLSLCSDVIVTVTRKSHAEARSGA